MAIDASAQVKHRYERQPDPIADDESYALQVPLDGLRPGVHLQASFARPGVVRDALLTLAEIVASDLRFKASDRSDYLAYLMAHGKRASQAVWDAQKEFLQAQFGEETQQQAPLDPMLSVSADGVDIEVFSEDESTYARLSLHAKTAYKTESFAPGTSHIEFTPDLQKALGRIRSYRRTRLDFQSSASGSEKSVQVPYRWLRAFGQVQTASTLPTECFELRPIDLYNVLFRLRMQRAKQAPRALRFELVPGQPARMVLEPWETVLQATGPVFQGKKPLVVRTWGRQRLALLTRMLPHTERLRVFLLGPGLPAFYVLDFGDASLTLALSGWTDSGWAGIATFDLLVPDTVDEVFAQRLMKHLQDQPQSLDQLSESLQRPRNEVRQALLSELLKGTVVHDIDTGIYHHRLITTQSIDSNLLRYRDAREEQAHRLLATADQVQLTRVHELVGEGTRIEGEVEDRQAHRSFRTSFTLDQEGRSGSAACTCPGFRRSGIKQGPCEHMIALRLFFARQQAALELARQSSEGRRLIRAETRRLIRRQRDPAQKQTQTYQITLDDRQVVLRWGSNPDPMTMRMQRLLFDNADMARGDYFARLESLQNKGYIDATAS